MKAVGYKNAGPITAENALEDIDAPMPELRPHDVLVQVKGISLNPVDCKLRSLITPETGHKILGYDGCGTITAIGEAVSNFAVGDDVFYAGDMTRQGSNAEFQAVDSRIIAKKPASLDYAEAAALPLTAITAWELLFDSLHLQEHGGDGKAILILGAAGGVGSILIQLVKALTKLTVIATASRSDTVAWVQKMGADHVIDHTKPLVPQLEALGIAPHYTASLRGTDKNWPEIVQASAPRAMIALIDDPKELNVNLGKQKALSLAWEFMFTRPMFDMDDIATQGALLQKISQMVDAGILQSTMTSHLGSLSADTLIEAHKTQDTSGVIGKNVMDGLGAQS